MGEHNLQIIAGITLGEGSFHIQKHIQNKAKDITYQPCISISNTEKEILEFCPKEIGGALFTNRLKTDKHKESYFLLINGFQNIIDVTEKIYPFLIGKKKKSAELIIKFCQSRIKLGRIKYTQEEIKIIEELKEINKRGISSSIN